MCGISYGISVPVIPAKCSSLNHETFSHTCLQFSGLWTSASAALYLFQHPAPDFLIPVSFPPSLPYLGPPHTRKSYKKHPFSVTKHTHDLISSLLRQDRPSGGASRGEGARQAELGREALDAVGGVQVLDHDHLEAGGAALARGDGGPGQEELPDAEPALAVLGLDGLGVAQPVAVPAPEGARVVDADGVDAAG